MRYQIRLAPLPPLSTHALSLSVPARARNTLDVTAALKTQDKCADTLRQRSGSAVRSNAPPQTFHFTN